MNTRLTINLRDGHLQVEGGEDFVRAVYQDFKERLAKTRHLNQAIGVDEPEDESGDRSDQGTLRRTKPRRKAAARKDMAANGAQEPKGSAGGMTRCEPKRDPDLDLSELATYAGQYELRSNPVRYLVYAQFLKDKLSIAPCSIDHLFSCFLEMKDDLPNNMGQNLVDTRARNGFLKFGSPETIEITTTGINHFNKKLKKKGKAG